MKWVIYSPFPWSSRWLIIFIPLNSTFSNINTVTDLNYAILREAFTGLNTYTRRKRFIPSPMTFCYNCICRTLVTPVAFANAYRLSMLLERQYIAVQMSHLPWCVHKVLFLWMLHRSYPLTCCFASVVTSLKLTGFVLKEWLVREWFCFKNYFWSMYSLFFFTTL